MRRSVTGAARTRSGCAARLDWGLKMELMRVNMTLDDAGLQTLDRLARERGEKRSETMRRLVHLSPLPARFADGGYPDGGHAVGPAVVPAAQSRALHRECQRHDSNLRQVRSSFAVAAALYDDSAPEYCSCRRYGESANCGEPNSAGYCAVVGARCATMQTAYMHALFARLLGLIDTIHARRPRRSAAAGVRKVSFRIPRVDVRKLDRRAREWDMPSRSAFMRFALSMADDILLGERAHGDMPGCVRVADFGGGLAELAECGRSLNEVAREANTADVEALYDWRYGQGPRFLLEFFDGIAKDLERLEKAYVSIVGRADELFPAAGVLL